MVDDRYLVRDLLGRGGMATVYRATDTATDRDVALKVLQSSEPGSVRRFGAEVDVLAHLDHPGLVKLRGSGTHDGVPYLVLDLAEGPSLAGTLVSGPIGIDRALAVGEQVAEALAHVHRLGVVHRDVKPSNILFDDLGRARLADFGIARLAGAPNLTGTGQFIGSAPYIAPEMVSGQQAGPGADVYALGLVVIECLTGRPCYPGNRVEAVISRLYQPAEVPIDLPRWLRDVLVAMTATDPVRRPVAGAVAAALRRREAEPVLAATAPIDREALTAVDEDVAAPPPDQAATTGSRRDATVDPTLTTGYEAPTGRAASAHSDGRSRPGGVPFAVDRRLAALVGAVIVCIALASLLALTVGRADAPVVSPVDGPAITSTTSQPATTVAAVQPPEAGGGDAPPPPGRESDGSNGHGNGRANGHGKGDKRG